MQEMLYAEHKHKVLIVLQGMDTAGKDRVIRKVFEGINPQGVQVASFKLPMPIELDHDYLWRAHQRVPANLENALSGAASRTGRGHHSLRNPGIKSGAGI
jgi:polyphosphate kinase 2 (PPK2 family)